MGFSSMIRTVSKQRIKIRIIRATRSTWKFTLIGYHMGWIQYPIHIIVIAAWITTHMISVHRAIKCRFELYTRQWHRRMHDPHVLDNAEFLLEIASTNVACEVFCIFSVAEIRVVSAQLTRFLVTETSNLKSKYLPAEKIKVKNCVSTEKRFHRTCNSHIQTNLELLASCSAFCDSSVDGVWRNVVSSCI